MLDRLKKIKYFRLIAIVIVVIIIGALSAINGRYYQRPPEKALIKEVQYKGISINIDPNWQFEMLASGDKYIIDNNKYLYVEVYRIDDYENVLLENPRLKGNLDSNNLDSSLSRADGTEISVYTNENTDKQHYNYIVGKNEEDKVGFIVIILRGDRDSANSLTDEYINYIIQTIKFDSKSTADYLHVNMQNKQEELSDNVELNNNEDLENQKTCDQMPPLEELTNNPTPYIGKTYVIDAINYGGSVTMFDGEKHIRSYIANLCMPDKTTVDDFFYLFINQHIWHDTPRRGSRVLALATFQGLDPDHDNKPYFRAISFWADRYKSEKPETAKKRIEKEGIPDYGNAYTD